MLLSPLQVNVGAIATDTSILSSVAIILGAVFVVYQIRQDKDMLAAQVRAADANAEQASLTMKQFLQNSELATMDLVMRIYEFADSMEVQSLGSRSSAPRSALWRTSIASPRTSSSRSTRSPPSSSPWGSSSRGGS